MEGGGRIYTEFAEEEHRGRGGGEFRLRSEDVVRFPGHALRDVLS